MLCTQILSTHIINNAIQGISIAGRDFIINQLADDTTNNFIMASGLCLNLNKCELLQIKSCKVQTICNIPIKEEVKYLGILISKDQKTKCPLNFSPIIKKPQNKLNQWLQRDLSLKGRVLLTKAEGLTRITYTGLSLLVDSKICKDIDRMLLNFIWKNRTHYYRKSVVMNTYEFGGQNFLDFTTLIKTFKIKWARIFF